MTDFVNSGLRSGLGSGLGSGLVSADPMAGVTRDATSGEYYPANNSEWTITMAAAGISSGNPSNCHQCQESSGNLADSIASLTLTAAGSPTYAAAVSGRTRKKVANGTDGSNNRFTATGADIATTSQLWMGMFDMPTANPAAARTLMAFGTNATRAAAEVLTSGLLRDRSVGTTQDGSDLKSAVRPLALQLNRAASVVRARTNQDSLSVALDGTSAGTALTLWGIAGANLSPICGTLYLARFVGAAAELTTTQITTLLTTLRWI